MGIASNITAASLAHRLPSREQIAAAIETMIAVLDAVDGDPDAEPIGDEQDAAWTEFHTRGRHKLALGGSRSTITRMPRTMIPIPPLRMNRSALIRRRIGALPATMACSPGPQ